MLEEEETVSGAEFAYSLMLTMSVTFQMSVFYLVNWPDADIRFYAWQIIGNTILIFCGVLFFSAFADVMFYAFGSSLLVDFSILLFIGFLSQLVIANCCGYFHREGTPHLHISSKDLKIENVLTCVRVTSGKKTAREVIEMSRVRNNECFASLMGHMTGFAAINSFGLVQHMAPFDKNPSMSFLAPVLAFLGLLGMSGFFKLIRKFVFRPSEETEEMWADVTVDKSNDVIGLACSALAFSSFRFAFIKGLPDIEGNITVTPEEAPAAIGKVIVLWFVFCCLGVLFLWVHVKSGWVNEKDEQCWGTRCSNIAQNFTFMVVAWCCRLIWALIIRYMNWFESCEDIPARITLAFVISYASFCLIFILDKVTDKIRASTTEEGQKAIEIDQIIDRIILAIGLAVGFAWEQSFDSAVDDMGNRLVNINELSSSSVVFVKFGGCCFLVLIVLPAFRLYIQAELEHAEEKKREENDKVKHESIKRHSTMHMQDCVKMKMLAMHKPLLESPAALGGSKSPAARVVTGNYI